MKKSEIIYYEPTIDDTIKIFKQNNFFNGRFNDGELIGIRERNNIFSCGENCDHHKYFPEMGNEMRDVLINYTYSDNYILSSTVTWYENNRDVIDEIFLLNPMLRFHSGYFFYDILKNPEYFNEFISFLNLKNVVIVGPQHNNDHTLFNNLTVIEVPIINAYTVINDVCLQIEEINKLENNVNYLFMCGMMSGIIIDRFQKTDRRNSYYDVGSALDFFFQSTKYQGRFVMRRQNIQLREKLNNHYKKYII